MPSFTMQSPADSSAPVSRGVKTSDGMQAASGDSLAPGKVEPQEPAVFRFMDGDTVILQELDYTGQTSVPLLFEGHQLRPVNPGPAPLSRRTSDWFTLTLIFVVISFSWIRVFYSKIFKQLISAFFSNSISNQVVRDENILVQRASILMSFVFYLTASLFVYQLSMYYNWDYPFLGEGFLRFLVVCLRSKPKHSVFSHNGFFAPKLLKGVKVKSVVGK